MKNETLLHEEIKHGFEVLDGVEKGSDEYKTIVDAQAKLIDKAIEIDRLNHEHEKEMNELKIDKIDKIVKNSLTGASIIGGLVTTWHWARTSFKFEGTGEMITSDPGKNFVRNALNFFKK